MLCKCYIMTGIDGKNREVVFTALSNQTQTRRFHRKKSFINTFLFMYVNNTLDKIYTSSNLQLGPKIKIPSTASYTKLIYCLKHYIHFHLLLLYVGSGITNADVDCFKQVKATV